VVRKSALIKAVSSGTPLSRAILPRELPGLLNKLYRVKSLFALPQIIRVAVSLAKVIPAREISAVGNDETGRAASNAPRFIGTHAAGP